MNGIGFSVGQAANRVGAVSAILIPGPDFGSFVNLSDNKIVVGGFLDVDGVAGIVDGATVMRVTFSAVPLGGESIGANTVVDDEVSGTGVVSMVTDVVSLVTGVVAIVTAVISMVTGAIGDKRAVSLSVLCG